MSNYFKHKMRGKSPGEIAGMIIFGGLFLTGLVILFGFIIMWLWNWLMPEIFGLTTLNYWQAIGLFILLKILIGGCGGFGNSGKVHQKNMSAKRSQKVNFLNGSIMINSGKKKETMLMKNLLNV